MLRHDDQPHIWSQAHNTVNYVRTEQPLPGTVIRSGNENLRYLLETCELYKRFRLAIALHDARIDMQVARELEVFLYHASAARQARRIRMALDGAGVT